MSEKRLRALDIAKGIAIILVVIGHAVPDATTHMGIQSDVLAIMHRLIYSFHMPLFFLISGYFVNTLAENQSRVSAIWKKFQRLHGAIYFCRALLCAVQIIAIPICQ